MNPTNNCLDALELINSEKNFDEFILLVGAMTSEVMPLLQIMEKITPINHRLFTGRIVGRNVALLKSGVGPKKAFERTQSAIGLLSVRGVISFGTCGSLIDEFHLGQVLFASSVDSIETDLYDLGDKARLITVDEPVFTATLKASLSSVADICDMEAGAVRKASGKIPFGALKVVSDFADNDPRLNPAKIMYFKKLSYDLVKNKLAHRLVEYFSTKHN